MVAAGATVLMAASEESSSNGTENSSRHYENQTGSSQCNEVQCSQQSIECSTKRNLMPCTSNTKEKNRSHMLDKTSRPTSRVESKEGSKTVTLHKTTPIRETKASRLRAASIISPSGGTSISRRIGVSESSSPWSLQPGTSLSFREHKCAQESPISSDSSSTMNPTRERDKSYKRKSYLNRSLNSEVAAPDRSNQSEYSERRSRRQSSKQGHISETISTSDSGAHRQTATNLQRKHLESKVTSQRVSAQYNTNRSRTHTSPSVACPVSTKYSNAQRTSNHGPSDSEVSRRVDALTALTRATMERVERLTSQANLLLANDEQRSEANSTSESSADNCEYSPDNPTNAAHEVPASPSKCSILKRSNDEYSQESNATRSPHAPVSILKHKLPDNETGQSSSNSSHATLPVTFSPSVVEPAHKRHGILKKRSSLDESEILRRRSCSPDVSFTDNSYSEFRPILKNQRRSSLDEIIKRDQSPDPQPTSILKRKSSREDDREDRQLGSPEPQGILKRKSANASRINNTFHHVTIATDMMAVAGGNDALESSEVRPILKKKHSREESSGNDPPSHEPRPILKKKSSTESDEHDDRPKKTILKCSRKSSQEDCDYETELTSPKKLSMLRNRVLQARGAGLLDGDNVRPILKQVAARDNESRVRMNLRENASSFDDDYTDPEDLFHRKRAQSVGHVQPSSGSNELTAVLSKRRSLESTSLIDMLQERIQPRAAPSNGGCSRAAILETDKGPSTSSYETTASATAEDEFACKANNKDKPTIPMFEAQEESNVDSHIFSINSNTDKDTKHSAQMTDSKKIDTKVCIDKMQEQVDMCDAQESYAVHRSNSVSKMALHFKTLQEKAQSTKDKDASAQRTPKKGSHGIQRYRERKVQGSDRFNTQPVTFQEVQEAVLQNQRSASRTDGLPDGENAGAEDEFDPSKLSLAERVRLFNQKIATEGTSGSLGGSQERHARRRPATRYKTQPITSEEVEVASRISPFSGSVHLPSTLGRTDESRGSIDARLPLTSQNELLKGILKSSNSHTHDVLRSKSPELEGLKLIKSVLKRESEELQQQQQQQEQQQEQQQQQQQQQQQTTTTENCDIFPRSILKTNSLAKSQEINSSHDNREEADGTASVQSRNANVETSHRDTTKDGTEDSDDIVQRNSHCAYGGSEGSNDADDEQNETKQRYTVPFYKSIISQDQSCKSRTNVALDSVDNALPESVVYRKRNREGKCSLADDSVRASDDETSSSGGREVRSIIKNEAIHRRRQAILAKQARSAALAKSASHHALSSETRSVQEQHSVPLPGLCRSATQTMPVAESNEGPAMSIADRLAALQRSGNTNWKRRVVSESSNISETINISKDELAIKQGVLADCLGKLESATEGWRKRITAPDVMKFTVAGKMKVEQSETLDVGPTSPLIEVTGNMLERKKKTPRPERFRGRRGDLKDTISTPSSPSKESPFTIRRSFSEPVSDDSGEENRSGQNLKPIVSVPKTDDETFTSFFTGISVEKCETESIEISESDFDVITPHSELLVHKRHIQMQRRRVTSKNPLKTLAARTDLKSEYTEIRTGVAEKVMRSLNVEKLAKNSPLAIEALAGLASTEDFSNITLRNASETSASTNKLRPYKDLMLILVKGRRHVQVRLVEPVFESINSGDNFVLVTKSDVYNYVGKFSNVIEKARAAEIALSIQQNKDLGCQASQVITIHEDKITCTKSQLQKFWTYLGAETENVDVVDGGHPEEDELYESAIIDTNMAYEIKDEELVPMEKYWGGLPKIEMLDPSKVLVFDFGTEMYIWSGKGALSEEKKAATRLATELWNEGYNYGECAVCPITTASMIGSRKPLADVKTAKSRPKWCLFAKLTQHVETVLFREKFLDWPNMSGIIRVRNADKEKEQTDGTITVEPCNVDDMLKPNTTPVDFILEGSHLGRGTGWYDDELMKQYVVTTQNVTAWHIDEFSHTLLDERYIGHFYTGDSYIIRWMYSVTITGRELSGLPSKHAAKGRDRSAYFIWQGNNASLNEQGAAALLTVVLDQDQGPQIRVVEGHEPAAFFNLFAGKMVVHQGKRTDKDLDKRWRLYMCRGTLETEVSLTEIPCSARQLRSRGSLVLVDCKKDVIYVWHGCNTLPHIRKNALNAANNLKKTGFDEIGLSVTAEISEIEETKEPEEFFNGLGGSNKKLYVSLDKQPIQNHTPRLFHLSSVLKEFQSTELLCPLRATELPTPFPFLQDELYQVNQPALFLLDNKDEIWIWQGWWPDTGAEDQSGSKAVRWQAERRATMTVAMQYWQNTHPVTTKFPIYLVWAGLEPLQFINLFPTWTYRDDIAELNIQDGRNAGEVLTVESELARLTQSTYPPAQLLQRPLPEGVDPTHLELYLSQQHFEELLGMSREEFQELPVWKQVNIKKEIGLF